MKKEYEAEESTSSNKTNLMDEAEDELLVVLGYKVRSSDMAGVAHKLEKALRSGLEDGISHLASNAIHYNPSEALAWHAHFTANQVIPEAFSSKSRVHVVDFSMKQGMQWPALMQALTVRPGGPLELRLTGIALPPQDNVDSLEEVGWKLAQMVETIGVKFKFRGVVASSLDDLKLR